MGRWDLHVGRARVFLSALVLGFVVLNSSMPAAGATAAGFSLLSSQTSPVTGAVTISAPDVRPEPGLVGVQFKIDGYVLNALTTTSPFEVIWSAASATNGDHTITAEVRLTSGVVIESAPLLLTVGNPTTFNRLLHVDAGAGNDGNTGLRATAAVQSLARVASLAQAGDTVVLRGTFTGQDLMPMASGTAAKPIIFTSDPGQPAVLQGGSLKLVGLHHVVVERLAILNGPIVLNGSNNNVFRDCQVSNVGNGSGQWGHAFRMTNSSDNLIERCTITDIGNEAENTGDSIWIDNGSSRNRILNNTLRNGGHTLMNIGGDRPGEAEVGDNVIAGNTLINPWTTPLILAWMTRRTLVENNRISLGATNGVNWPRAGIQLQSNDNIIRYNEIFDNAAAGIMIQGFVYNGNIPQDSIGNQIYNNVFYNNNRIQDFVNNAGALHFRISNGRTITQNVIENNIFFRNGGFQYQGNTYTITINHYDNGSAWPEGNLNGNVIKNNIFLRQPGSAGTPLVLHIRNSAQGGNVSYTLPGFQQISSAAFANFESDPMFTDEANRAFTLRSGSPAIDRGVAIPGVAYLGTAPDLGANEYDGGGGPPADTIPPTVAVTAPSVGQTVSGMVTIRASASDNVGVTRIDYLQDGQVLGVLSPPALTFSWDTAAVSNGPHTLTARGYDAAGNVGTSVPVAVTVANADTTKPTVAITTPTTNPTYSTSSSSLTLGGTASDNVGVTQVTWTNSRGGSGTTTGTTSWTASGIVLQAGSNVLTVTARDAASNTTTASMTVTFTDTTTPTVTITTPTGNPTYTTGNSSLTLGGTASDNVGVTQVTWTNSSGGSGTATGTTSWTASGIALQLGSNVLTVTARDAAGNTATDTLTVTRSDSTPPTVTITVPTASPAYTTSTPALTLGGTATDNLGVTQVTWVNNRGGSGTATGTTSWTAGGITLQTGANVLTVTARDAAGNTATASMTVTLSGTLPFTDDPLAAQSTSIKAVHVTELRATIDSVRVARGLGTFAWTDSTLTPGITPVKAVHLTQLRTALNQAYQAAGRTAPTYTDPTGPTVIKALHLNELRAAASAL